MVRPGLISRARVHKVMLRYRKFTNSDPPSLVEIWRSRAGRNGLLQPISVGVLEQCIFSKAYFDYEGLILAFDQDRPVGFAHAGFGPSENRDRISTDKGVICILVVRPDCPETEVAAGLLEQSEAYLRRRGATVVYGGAVQPMNPFYAGLYGGSELPGVLQSDLVAQQVYRSQGYEEIDRTVVFRRELDPFRPTIDRQHLHVRRKMLVETKVDPPARNWWEACTAGDLDLTQFELIPRGGGPPAAVAIVRAMEPAIDSKPGLTAGLIDLEVQLPERRQGLATFLLAEAFRQLSRQGVTALEAQASRGNVACCRLLRKLGLEEVNEGIVFRKEVARS